MTRLLAILLASALWLTGCSAADPLGEHDWPQPSPALWEVTSPEGHTGWLFGTVHALPDGMDWRTQVLDDALTNSGLLIVEIADLGENREAASLFADLSFGNGLPPLLERIPQGERQALQSLLGKARMDEADFNETETWAAALILSGAMRSGAPENGVDRALIAQASEIVGLEGYDRQYKIFDSLPDTEQANLLLAVVHESVGFDPVPALESWLTGDLASLLALADGGMLADPELRTALLDQRNRDWTGPISLHITRGEKPFVAVGAAHMLGKKGLPELLRARGFRVTRIQ